MRGNVLSCHNCHESISNRIEQSNSYSKPGTTPLLLPKTEMGTISIRGCQNLFRKMVFPKDWEDMAGSHRMPVSHVLDKIAVYRYFWVLYHY